MATKTTERESDEAVEDKKPQSDGPLLDLTDQAVKRMIKLAKKRGFVTYEELNDVLPSEEFTSDLGCLPPSGLFGKKCRRIRRQRRHPCRHARQR